jgi:Flp pilus assembly protein TadG
LSCARKGDGMGLRRRRAVTSSRDERGAVVVEFALIFPILMLLIFGIVDFGWMIERGNVVNNVTRDAARVASLGGTYAQVQSTVTTGLADYDITAPGPNVTISITCTNPDGSVCSNSASSYDSRVTSGSSIKVRVVYTHNWITPVGAICDLIADPCVGDTISLARTAEMVRE